MTKRERIYISILLVLLLLPKPLVQAAALPDVIITELQTSNATASEEFIELYNTTDHDIDLADVAHQGQDVWKLQFFSSTKVVVAGFAWDPKTSGLTTMPLTRADNTPVIIKSHDYVLVGTAGYTPLSVGPDLTYTSGRMSDAGGGIQLVDVASSGTTQTISPHDHLGWFQPSSGTPLPAGLMLPPVSGSSLQRTITKSGSYFTDTGDLQPFIGSDHVSPKAPWVLPPDPEVDMPSADEHPDLVVLDTPVQTTTDTSVASADPSSLQPTGTESTDQPPEVQPAADQPVIQSVSLLPLQLTELLPNPAAPQTDDQDEYIELYNPNDQAIDLAGYTIKTGLKLSYSYTFGHLNIPAQGYLKVTSSSTRLSLANSGGQAQLLDSTGSVVSQTDVYGAAADGQGWAMINGVWQWTTTPTPAAANVLTALPPPATKTAATKTTAAKTTKATTSKKASTTSVKSAKTTKTTTTKKPANTSFSLAQDTPARPVHIAVLVGVGVVAILYGLYEYRADMGNRLHQLRRHRETRRATRQTATGR